MKPHNVLVVDDDEDLAKMLSLYLRRLGYLAQFATSSEKALHELTKGMCDVSIVDLTMPEMDGLALIARIRQRFPGMPILVYTGCGYVEGLMQEALRAGANAYVSKNVSVEELYLALHRVLTPKRLPCRTTRMCVEAAAA